MKLGILNAFPPEMDSVNWDGTAVDGYIRFLDRVNTPFEYVGYEAAQGQLPASPEACDAYLITGSPVGVYDAAEWLGGLSSFIRDCYQAGIKLVGICFGHQILAHALGGHAEKSEKGWGLGLKTFDVTTPQPWMGDPPASCALHFIHQDQVMRLPPEAEHLGGNDFCPNAFFVIGDRVLGIQGHPEFTTGMMQDLLPLVEDRAGITPQVYSAAVQATAHGTPDNQLVAQWVVNFLTGGSAQE